MSIAEFFMQGVLMKRAGFTMIELIFVIVIIGILAAVALPKLVGVQESARVAKAGEFAAQLNSVIGPSLYSKAILAHEGSIKNFLADGNISAAGKDQLSYYIEIPSQFGNFDKTAIAAASASSAAPILSDTTNNIYIYCRDGNATDVPRFWYSTKTAATPSSDFNISKASF